MAGASRTRPGGRRFQAAEKLAGRVEGAGSSAADHGVSGGHLRSQDLQAVYTEDLTSPTGSRTPAGPLERPPGESWQGRRRAVKVHREASGRVRAGGSGA